IFALPTGVPNREKHERAIAEAMEALRKGLTEKERLRKLDDAVAQASALVRAFGPTAHAASVSAAVIADAVGALAFKGDPIHFVAQALRNAPIAVGEVARSDHPVAATAFYNRTVEANAL